MIDEYDYDDECVECGESVNDLVNETCEGCGDPLCVTCESVGLCSSCEDELDYGDDYGDEDEWDLPEEDGGAGSRYRKVVFWSAVIAAFFTYILVMAFLGA